MDITRNLPIPILDLGHGVAGVTTIERELAATDGVVRAYVDRATGTAYVDYDPLETDMSALVQAIERGGYRVGRDEASSGAPFHAGRPNRNGLRGLVRARPRP